MSPDHEARHGLFTRDVDNRDDLAYVKLINTYDNETIEKSLLGRLCNKWMSLRLGIVNQEAAKTYIMKYSALLDEMSNGGSPIDSTAAKVVFLKKRNVVVDLSEEEYSLQGCYKWVGRVGISIETVTARRASSNQRNINGVTTNALSSTYRGKPIDSKGFFKKKSDYNNMNADERKSYFYTKKHWKKQGLLSKSNEKDDSNNADRQRLILRWFLKYEIA